MNVQPTILQMLNGTAPQTTGSLAQIKEIVGKLRGMSNPQAMLQQMLPQRSPQLAQAMELVKQHGGDAKAACMELAREKGIDPAELEGLLK